MENELRFVMAAAEGDGDKGKAKVSGMAYGGGKIRQFWGDTVVDLTGLNIPAQVPLLMNHENRTSARIGMVAATIQNGELHIEGEIVSDTADAQNIIEQGKAGADWQLSIGAEISECLEVKENREVNGQMITAPFFLVQASVLREVSVVAVGADATTQMKVAANFNFVNQPKEIIMEDKNKKLDVQAAAPTVEKPVVENTVKAAVVETPAVEKADITAAISAGIQEERQRIATIRAICNGEFPEIEAKAISEGWDETQVNKEVLAGIRAARPTTSVNISVHSAPEGPEWRKTIEAALCLRAGVSEDLMLKSYEEKVVEGAMREMDMPLRDVVAECAKLDGQTVSRGFSNETIRAAFSTVSLPGILGNVANKTLLQGYTAQPIIATKLCSTGNLTDFKKTERYRLTDVGDLKPVAPDGEIKDGGLTEEAAFNQLETYGKKFCLTRQMIINDDLGAFMKVPGAMGARAARLVDQLFFSRLLQNPTQADNNALFSAAHANLLTGSNSALSADSLKKAIQLFLDQVDADGQPISVEPKYLLVPSALRHLAVELTQGATLIMAGNTNTVRPALNVIANENLQVVSSPYLGNASYAGASQTGWYLFGDPASVDTFEIGYLKGKKTPTIERGETDFNTLGMWFRVYFDLGVREQDHRGMVKATGVN